MQGCIFRPIFAAILAYNSHVPTVCRSPLQLLYSAQNEWNKIEGMICPLRDLD
jgi:hypothetical protein